MEIKTILREHILRKFLLALTLSLPPGPADITVPLSTLPNPCSGKITPPFVVYKT